MGLVDAASWALDLCVDDLDAASAPSALRLKEQRDAIRHIRDPWDVLSGTILLLIHLVRQGAGDGLEVTQEGAVRFLCVTGVITRLTDLIQQNSFALCKVWVSSAMNPFVSRQVSLRTHSAHIRPKVLSL